MKKRLTAVLLAVLMIVPLMSAAVFAADGKGSDGWYSVSFEKGSGSSFFGFDENKADKESAGKTRYSANDTVRVSIVLTGAPTIEKYSSDGVSENRAAVNYRAKLKSNQDKVADKISKTVLNGKKLDIVWNLTLAANIISANVEYGKIENIKKLPEVKNVVIETYHNIAEDEYAKETADPEMYTAGGMTNTYSVWAEGYTGAGSSVAVIDTGIDTKHISFDGAAYEYALETSGEEVDIITKDDIAAVFDQLNVKKMAQDLTVDDVYISSKIPFAYNYVDNNLDVTHVNDTQGEHGSHVAGIAAANRYVPDGKGGFEEALTEVKTQGQAPDAQLIVMKVFGNRGGAYDSDYFAAIEDAIVLGADAANLSLGSGNPGFTTDPDYQEIIDSLEKCNTTVTISAGNAGYWAENTFAGLLYAEDKSMSMTGSPSTMSNSLSVASVDNSGMTAPVIEFADRSISYSETTSYGADPLDTLTGVQEFIAIDGFGLEEDFDAIADVLPGKIFICSRGENSFYVKADNAAEYGAVATIIYNNVSASISMNLTGYSHTAPVTIISLEDGGFIKENAEKVTDSEGKVIYYKGTINIPKGVRISAPELDYYIMSDFSSWGVPGSLLLKPEITAPGGNIYSVYGENKNDKGIMEAVGNNRYELMSGTSMAAPQIAGISALISEYIRKNDLEKKTGLTKRQLTTSLLMGTARPLIEESSDNYYSVLKQGSGLADTEAVFSTHTFITMAEDATASYADGKVKAEIGEISRDTKSFDFTFYVNNFSDQASDYRLKADFFTQDYAEGPDYNEYGEIRCDEDGNEMTRLYMDLSTTSLKARVAWTVNGVNVSAENDKKYDFDSDGVLTEEDVLIVLEYVVGNIDTFDLMENADADGDGDIDTYDAYLIEELLNKATITVPANGSTEVNVSVTLTDIDDYDINGAYAEGFVFAAEQDGEGVVSSIPVFGYYGSWADFSMFDHGSSTEAAHGTADTTPYMAYDLGESAYNTNYFSVNYKKYGAFAYNGNPFETDDVYMPERNAIAPGDTIASVRYTLIRNADDSEVIITDPEGKELFRQSYGRLDSAFYEDSDEAWWNTTGSKGINFDPSSLPEGSVFTVTFRTALEYYTMKGEVDWDSFPDSTRFSQQFTVDGTAPEILAMEFHYDEEAQAYDAARITVKDNQHTAFVALVDEDDNAVCTTGSDNDPTAAAGSERLIVFDFNEVYDDPRDLPEHLAIYVYDYAANETVYYINLNEEELEQDIQIIFEKDEISLPVNAYGQVKTSVTPWGKNCDIIWSSADENIATVDEYGTIKGVSIGSTVIIAADEDDPNVYSELTVNVISLNRLYSGVLWDDNADKWFITFDPEDLYGYTVDLNEPLSYPLTSLCYGIDGTLYGITYNEAEGASDVYIIDPDTYEETYLGSPGLGYTDAAAAPAVSAFINHELMVGTYYNYLLWFDTDDGSLYDWLDFSNYLLGDSIVGIAFDSSVIDEASGAYIDGYYLVDITGELYYAQIITYADPEYGMVIDILDVYDLGSIGEAADVPYFQSLYLDTDGYLVWSRTVVADEDSHVYIYVYDVTDIDNIEKYDFGTLDYYVWPIGGIYEKNKSRAFDYRDLVKTDDTDGQSSVPDAETAEIAEIVKAKPAETGLSVSSVKETRTVPRAAKAEASSEAAEGYVSFDITADDITNNGLYTVSFSPDVYAIAGIDTDAEFTAFKMTDGALTLAFVDPEGYNENDVIATIRLADFSDGLKTVTVTKRESNADHMWDMDYLFVSEIPVYSEPVWVWSDELDSATVTFDRSDGYSATLDADVVKTEDKGVITYTATAVFNNETYTDVKTEYIEYKIQFVDHDGTVIDEKTYHYGDTVTVPEDPKRDEDDNYTYTFKGWDKEIASVTEDAVYTATYEAAEKTHFLPGDINGDGEVDNKDVVVLFRFVSGSDIVVNEAALDVNGDGEVDNKDVIVLFRHLSNDEIEISGKPYSPASGRVIFAVITQRIKALLSKTERMF